MPPTPPRSRRRLRGALLALVAALLATGVQAGAQLAQIRERGHLLCGVGPGMVGFSKPDAAGRWQGLDVDICRAVAAAVLGDGQKVRYIPLPAKTRFTALQSGEIDLLSRTTTITLERDAGMGLQMTAISYYDAQGFLVPVASKLRSARELKDKTVCVHPDSTNIRNLAEYSRKHRLHIRALPVESIADGTAAYLAGKCAAYSGDMSLLAAARTTLAPSPTAHQVLNDIVAKEPLGPMVRRGDPEWTTIVRWVVHGLVEAEELGIQRSNIEQLRTTSADPSVQRLLGVGEDMGKLLGLDREWLLRALRETGNYGEIFERNVGPQSPLGLPRGLNHLWSRGGLMYALPLR